MDELLERNKRLQEYINLRKTRNYLFITCLVLMYFGVFFLGESGFILTKVFTFFDTAKYQSTFFKYYQASFILCFIAFLISENRNFGYRLFFIVLTRWLCLFYITINVLLLITFLSISV